MNKFINLHVHSEFSILDGCGRQTDFIQRAGEMGQGALAFTDHGTLRGAYNFHKKAQGIKAIHGIEFYLTRDHKVRGLPEEEIQTIKTNLDGKGKLIIKKALRARGEELGVRKTNHVTVLAKTNQGLKNLYRLASIGWLEGFYYRPRIDLNLLHQYGDGLIVLSGCLQGMVSQLLLEDKIEEALEMAEAFQGRWGEDFYLEMMPNSIPNQAKVNRALVQIAHGLGISLVVTIDAHYPRRADWKAHDVLLCVNTKKKLNDPERWRFSAQDFWLHSRKEVLAGFKVHHSSIPRETVLEAIASTEEIAGKCEANLEIDTGALFIPDPLGAKNDFQELMSLSWEGWDSRDIPAKAEAQGIDENVYLDRLKKELSQIRKQKVSKYFLVVWDLCRWARSQDITIGPGRGSAGGCLVAYLLRITDIDPVAHGLLFERFLSPERIDIPDIDLDVEDRRRGEIIGYLKEKYGEDCVCQISTVAAMKGRLCLRDIGRALDLPYGEIDQIAASLVIKDEERDKPILEEAFTNIPVCQAFNKKHPEVLQYAKTLECQARHLGLHAAGVLVSSVPLQEIIPLETRNHKGERVVCSGWDMKGCEAAGLLKIDILGLRNLSVNADCLQAIEDAKLEGPIWEDMGLDDQDVLQDFSDGHFIGIFQFDTSSAAAMSKGVNFERFEDIVAMVALDRPGTARSGLATQFLERKADPSKRKPFHPIVDKICEDTHGVLVFQEQISKLFIELAGYSPGEADGVRKAVGKKLGLGDHKEKFIKGAVSQGMKKEDAEKLSAQINHFGAYGFNKCITGDTLVYRAGANKNHGPEVSVGDLFQAQQSRTPWGEKIRGKRLKILKLDDDGRIRPGFLKAIHLNGRRRVFEIETENGRKIKATKGHRFLSDQGFRKVRDLKVGDLLFCMGDVEKSKKRDQQCERARGKTYKGKGFKSGSENPSWVDGRRPIFEQSKRNVILRSAGLCEQCRKSKEKMERFEIAHLKSFIECDSKFSIYHSESNMKYLCNSCHKRFDYQKGERKPRWSKGRSIEIDKIISIEFSGEEIVYDIEMLESPHNFIANRIVSHNSHSTAYALTAYRQMYLKRYFPVQFMWALMKNEPDRHQIRRFLGEARRLGITVNPPLIGLSQADFTIHEEDESITCSFSDLKGIGPAAVESLVNDGPFENFPDFIKRTNTRSVNKRVVETLAKAGAFRNYILNLRWFIENLEEVWKKRTSKKFSEWWGDNQGNAIKWPFYSEEEKAILASEVSPFGGGGHPIEPFKVDLDQWRILWSDLGDEIWERPWAWVRGIIVANKYARVGDYHSSGEDLTSEEKEKRGWGKQFATLNLEGLEGSKKIKVNWDRMNPDMRTVIDQGVGTPVIALLAINAPYKSLQVRVLWPLKEMWEKVKADKLNLFERSIIHSKGLLSGHKSQDLTRRVLLGGKKRSGVAVVVSVIERIDKNLRPFARIGFWGVSGFLEAVCFSSNWDHIQKRVSEGQLVEVKVESSGMGWVIKDLEVLRSGLTK